MFNGRGHFVGWTLGLKLPYRLFAFEFPSGSHGAAVAALGMAAEAARGRVLAALAM